jgi:hypothetical protein
MGRTKKQKWLIGCLSALGGLVILAGLALLAFFKVMDAMKKVSPENTQIVLYNDTDEQLRIDRIDYGEEHVVIDGDPILAVKEPDRYTGLEQIFGVINRKCRERCLFGIPD